MEYSVKPYIYPIMDGNICIGQGFIADGYFITAAHVVKDNPNCYIMAGEHKMPLCKFKYSYGRKSIDAYYVGRGDDYKNANQIDIIMYKWGSGDGPLHLNIHKPVMGEILKSHCVIPQFNSKTNKYYLDYSVEDALVLGEEEGNYFYCKCKRFGGSSGSPLLWENQVIGIMHGGDEKYQICAFLRIDSFILSTGIEVQYDKSEIISKLLPYGADRITAIVILHAMNRDLSIMGIDLAEEGVYETGYYSCLRRLPFNVYELTEEERDALDEYFTYIVSRV